LYKADLINRQKPVVEVTGVDASDADLSRTILGGVDLRGADLSGAGLRGAVLVETDLSCALQCMSGQSVARAVPT